MSWQALNQPILSLRGPQGRGNPVRIEEQEVAGMGAFSLFLDPERRVIGLRKTAEKKG